MKFNILILFLIFMLFHQWIFCGTPEEEVVFSSNFFWMIESDFKRLVGVKQVVPVYTTEFANEDLKGGLEHIAVKIVYNPDIIAYGQLLNKFLRSIDPCDPHNVNTIYLFSDEQENTTLCFLEKIKSLRPFYDKAITLRIKKNHPVFYKTDEGYKNYAENNPFLYQFELSRSGMDIFLKEVWAKIPHDFFFKDESPPFLLYTRNVEMEQRFAEFSKPSKEELQMQLTEEQFRVTQLNQMEKAFENAYFEQRQRGLYVDIVSREPLFSSKDKLFVNNGRPVFSRSVAPHFLIEKHDFTFYEHRIELRSRHADSYLGFLDFQESREPQILYIVNSASLFFIHYDQLEMEGYGDYKSFV